MRSLNREPCHWNTTDNSITENIKEDPATDDTTKEPSENPNTKDPWEDLYLRSCLHEAINLSELLAGRCISLSKSKSSKLERKLILTHVRFQQGKMILSR